MKITASIAGCVGVETITSQADAYVQASSNGVEYNALHVVAHSADDLRTIGEMFLRIAAASEKTEEDGA